MPDLRGLFLRGVGGNSAALGIQQGDAIRNITGKLQIGIIDWMIDTAGFIVKSGTAGNRHGSTGSPGTILEFDASRVVPTANENRPVNMAVRYLIRALP